MLPCLLVALLQAPVHEATPPISPVPVTREFNYRKLRVVTTQYLAPRPLMNRRFGFDMVLQPVFIVEIESRLPVLRHFVIEVESRPALASGLVPPVAARLQLKLPHNARIGVEQILLGAFTVGLKSLGFLGPLRGPRATFTMKF